MIEKILVTVFMIFVYSQVHSQYRMLEDSLITYSQSDRLINEQNFPEFFLFSEHNEVFINIRDLNNNSWKTIQLFEGLSDFIIEINITSDWIVNDINEVDVNVLFIRWKLELHHSWGRGGFSSETEMIQVIDLENALKVIEFTPYFETNGSYGSNTELTVEGGEYECEYTTDYSFSNDTLYVKSIDVMKSKIFEYQSPTEGNKGESTETTGPNPDCFPKIGEGTYVFDGVKYQKLIDK